MIRVRLIDENGKTIRLKAGYVISYDEAAQAVKISDGHGKPFLWKRFKEHEGDDKELVPYIEKKNFRELAQLIGATHGLHIEEYNSAEFSFRFILDR